MPHYKLTYFDIRGFGEGARLIFAQAGVKYDDVRMDMKSTDYKKIAPFGKLPILDVDGEVIAESRAICRYLARQFGMAGGNAIEEARVDSIVDAIQDFADSIRDFFRVAFKFAEGDQNKLYDDLVLPQRERVFPTMEKWLAKSGSGFLVGKSVTWADVVLQEYFWKINAVEPRFLDGYPKLQAWVEKVRSLPNLKKYLAERPPAAV